MSVPIISVTGTKGKTTTVAVIADVLQKLQKNVLKVDTTGHFMNGERRSTLDDSKASWRLVPSVCPGRYLWEFHANPSLVENGVAVLECSLGCSASSGLGYRYHKVGVFLNVFEDHIGSSDRISNKQDIAIAKEFIFSRILHDDSYAVFNADDPLVCGRLSVLPESVNINLIPCGITFSAFDVASHIEKGGKAITINDKKCIVLRSKIGDKELFDITSIPWTFKGMFEPSVWNLLHAAGAIYGYLDGKLPKNFKDLMESVRLDPYGGRLTLLKNDSGVTILADYAHEKQSLVQVASLARSFVAPGGKLIGVVRLAHDRADDLMIDTGKTIAPHYDQFVVFDKIDGFLRIPKVSNSRFREIVGRTSEIFSGAIKEVNPATERVIREDEAINRAAELANPGDVVVIIVNDNIHRSIGFIKDAFKADFV